jgi:D-serine deaminase-like pyridoxal phosphate-dependent protein
MELGKCDLTSAVDAGLVVLTAPAPALVPADCVDPLAVVAPAVAAEAAPWAVFVSLETPPARCCVAPPAVEVEAEPCVP